MQQLDIVLVILLRCLLEGSLGVATEIQYITRVASQCRLPTWFMLYEHISQVNCAYHCALTPCCSHVSYNNGNQTCALSAVYLNLICAEESSGWSLHQLLDGPVVSRAEWGAKAARQITDLKTPVSVVTIHNSVHSDAGCQNKQECSQEMRGLQNYHLSLGRHDIIFNIVIGNDGRAYEGRGWDVIGQINRGWNDVALSFSIMGSYSDKQPDAEVIQTLKHVIDCGVKLGKITSDYKLYGHKDLSSISDSNCPNEKLYEVIKTWEHFDSNTPVKPTPIP